MMRAEQAGRRVTRSPEETESLGRALGEALVAGDVISLRGPLGSGKTRFVAGLARGMACQARVRSPSFTLVNEYAGGTTLLHLDLYRLGPHDVDALGLGDRLEEAVLAVEWGEKLPDELRARGLDLEFAIRSAEEREIAASAFAGRGLELLRRWYVVAGEREEPLTR